MEKPVFSPRLVTNIILFVYNKHINDVVESINIDTVNINNESVNNYALLGIAALKEGNHEKCGFYADDILKRKENSPEGLLLKAFFVSNNYSKEDGFSLKSNKLVEISLLSENIEVK